MSNHNKKFFSIIIVIALLFFFVLDKRFGSRCNGDSRNRTNKRMG